MAHDDPYKIWWCQKKESEPDQQQAKKQNVKWQTDKKYINICQMPLL